MGNELAWHGTLIAVAIINDSIHLFSDGRVKDLKTGVVNDSWSKIHKINNRVGMLTLGISLPSLKDDIIRNCDERGFTDIEDVAPIVSDVLRLTVETARKVPENNEVIEKHPVFIFLTGFDKCNKPRLFYLDQRTLPPFAIQERVLDASRDKLEMTGMSTESGISEDPTSQIMKYISEEHGKFSGQNIGEIINQAFEKTKRILSEKHPNSIGGRTFWSRIDGNGFMNVS